MKKFEWSKLFCTVVALFLGVYGVWCGIEYYRLCKLAIETFSTMPDATLAVTSLTTVIASLLSYLLYQAGLKNSRNKYGVDVDGKPFNIKDNDDESSDIMG